jgi:hypothetical protein
MNPEIIARMRAKLEANISQYGWAVQSVFGTVENPGAPFAYTIGLHDKGVPELLVIGLPGEIAHPLINELATRMLALQASGLSLLGDYEPPGYPVLMRLIAANPDTASGYATGAYNRSQGQASYIQVIWQDKHGHWPWQDEASEGFKAVQPVLSIPGLH